MKKKVLSCLALICIIIFAYFYAGIDKNIYLYNRNLEANQLIGSGILQENETIAQTFTSKENTIDGFYIKVAFSGNPDKVKLHCSLFDEASKEVAKTSVSGSKLENNKFYHLSIPTVSDTQDKQYTLVLAEEGADEKNGISFYIAPTQQDNQKLTISDKETQGSLVARVICHRFDVETFFVFLGMIAFITIFMRILFKMFK